MSRLSPKPDEVRRLFARSGNQCAFPSCQHLLISNRGTFIAQICHIEAANRKGQRFNPKQTDEQRRAYDNLLILCYEHHRETDDEDEFPVPKLQEMKRQHEEKYKGQYELPERLEEKVLNAIQRQIDQIEYLSRDTNTTVHTMDEKLDELLRRINPETINNDEIFNSYLETIKEVKSQGKVKTAIDLLLALKSKYWSKLSPEKQYKVTANIGLCYIELQDKANGAKYLLELETVPFEDGSSLANLCLGYALAGRGIEFDRCFKKAIEANTENTNLWVAYVERHRKQKPASELLKDIPSSVQESIPVMFSMAHLLIEDGQKAEGIALLEQTLIKQDESLEKVADTKALVATQLMRDLVNPVKYAFKIILKRN